MVKVTGPLNSEGASGSIGKALTISSYKGKAYIRRHVTPKNPNSPAQLAMRAMLSFLASQWATLTPADQATWTTLAEQTGIEPFNAYVAHNQARWHRLKTPTKTYPDTPSPPTPNAPVVTAAGDVHHASLDIVPGLHPPDWGYTIHRQKGGAFLLQWSNLVAVIPFAAYHTPFEDAPLDAGTYSYKLRAFHHEGGNSATSANKTATVT